MPSEISMKITFDVLALKLGLIMDLCEYCLTNHVDDPRRQSSWAMHVMMLEQAGWVS